MSTPPSGRQVVLVHGDQQAVVVEVGGGLRSYVAGVRPVLDGYAEDEVCRGGRGQALLPWPNRVGDGRYRWQDVDHQLALTEPEVGNAIHGLTRWAPWQVLAASTDRAILGIRLHPQPGWDWTLDLTLAYRLGPSGLDVTVGARNLSRSACPFGAGFHPYLAAFGGTVDEVVLSVPASSRYLADGRGLPTGRVEVAGSELDFRAGRPIASLVLDTAFTDLIRDDGGRAVVEVTAGSGAERTQLWMDGAFTHVMVFSGDNLADPARRRRGLAVEPMTAPPDMLRSGDGRLVLAPGERFEGRWGIQAT